MSVEESVFLANRKYGHEFKPRKQTCPRCGEDNWKIFFGINSEYRSEFNPGEFIQYTCACGYEGPEMPS